MLDELSEIAAKIRELVKDLTATDRARVWAVVNRKFKAVPPLPREVEQFWFTENLEVAQGYSLPAHQAEANAFWNYWESKGWRDSSGPIRDWRARARLWSSRVNSGRGKSGPAIKRERLDAYKKKVLS
jgi:hypothetical protein